MAAQALYLKYRPRTFDEVVGQEAITRTLRNALRQSRIRHAYLFTGPRGTGKTTTARLLAKAVNCLAPEAERPCNTCALCTAINEGRLLDLIEIDAASNRGIDEIRDIREKVGFRPNEARFKVYVLDEAHMLTEPAFNALLKTLEEPPPHVIFTLVTTDPHKIPPTITSRCQRFDFRRISMQAVIDRLAYIADQEGLQVDAAALDLIARHSTGAMRDAISLLDQLMGYGGPISVDQVQMVLGTSAGEAAGRLAAHLAGGDAAGGLALINQAISDGVDPRQFGREVVEYLRGLLLIKEGAGTRLLGGGAEQAAEMEALAGRFSRERLLDAIRRFNSAATDLKSGLQTIPQLPLEMALVESLADAAAPAPARPAPPSERGAAPPKGLPAREARAVAVKEPAAPPVTAEPPSPEPSAEPPPVPEAAGAPGLTFDRVVALWPEVLRAVRQRNATTQAVLNSGCKPVEVAGDEIVITFPNPFLGGKLEDPERKREVQESLDGVLGVRCRVKWVLERDYKPRAVAPARDLDEDALERISRWAADRGGQTRIVQ